MTPIVIQWISFLQMIQYEANPMEFGSNNKNEVLNGTILNGANLALQK